jgi:hypothetical protein
MDCEQIRELLEAYALDALEPDERVEVERHMATCPECREHAAALAETVARFPAALANASPAAPPDDLRERLLAAVAAQAVLSHREAPAVSTGDTTALVDPGPRLHRPLRLLGYAVPALLLVFSLAWGFRLAAALERERDLREEYVDLVDDVVGQQELVFEVIGFDDTVRQFLSAQQEGSTSYGKVFTRPGMPFVVVMAGRLPPAPAGETFHVWVTADGKTTLLGELTMDDAGFGLLVVTVEQPGPVYETAFVTLQPPGGASPAGVEILRHEPEGAS